MRVSLRWLADYVESNLPPQELAHRITMAGTEVDSVDLIGGTWDSILVGQVTAKDRHPNADRLCLATVDLGNESMTVVCGAPNIEAGQKVPFAKIGAQLIDGHTGNVEVLKPAKIRGVRSEGMVCSEMELGISDSHEGIMVLPEDAPVGAPLAGYLGDTVLDMSPTPNRPDCLSMIGIAREVAALTGQPTRVPEISYAEEDAPIEGRVTVDILDPELCPRYCAALISGVKIGPSPQWMQQRLLAAGMRPISNVVDITNYVMLEYGQPLHAFDYEQVKGGKVIVRRAKDGEILYTLDGVERKLDSDMLVIADESDPIALAGVMGGAESEVIEITKTILLESANFNGGSIRRTSTRLGLRSEASSRFEKGLSPELAPFGLRRAVELLIELAGGKAAKGIVDTYPVRQESKPILLPRQRIGRILGIEPTGEHVVEVLSSLDFECQGVPNTEDLLVTVPYWRTDVRQADDLIEEVARIIGYDEIPTTMLHGRIPERPPAPLADLRETVCDILAGCGMQQIIAYSLVSQAALDKVDRESKLGEPLRIANPMNSEQECMRTTLRPGLLSTLVANERYEAGGIRLFEAGKVYFPRPNDLPEEKEMVAGVLSGPRLDQSWLSAEGDLDFFDAKGIVETLLGHLHVEAGFEPAVDQVLLQGRTALVRANGQTIGILGEMHPRVVAAFDISRQPVTLFEIDLESLLPLIGKAVTYRPLARFPEIVRDLAVVVDWGVPARRVQDIIRGFALVSQVYVFDMYTGKQVPQGKKSLAFSIRYQSPERTLTDEEVDKTQQKIIEKLSRELGATIRS